MNGGRNQYPQKNPWTKIQPPKKSHSEFQSRKNFQRNYAARIRRNYHESSDCLEYPKKSLLKSSYSKKYLPKFSFPKKSQIENFILKKSFDHPCHLKSGVPPWDDQLSGFESRQASIFFRLSHSNCISCISL